MIYKLINIIHVFIAIVSYVHGTTILIKLKLRLGEQLRIPLALHGHTHLIRIVSVLLSRLVKARGNRHASTRV